MSTKREIDKENMFRKIMPSAGQPGPDRAKSSPQTAESPLHYSSKPEPAQPIQEHVFAQSTFQTEPLYAQAVPEQDPTLFQQPPNEPPVQQQTVHTELPNPAPQPIIASPQPPPAEITAEDIVQIGERPKPLNLPELVAERYYERYQLRLNCCTCQHCRDDVFAITLNKVRTRYVASDRLDLHALDNREMITETVTALIRALLMVKRNPHHSEQDFLRQ